MSSSSSSSLSIISCSGHAAAMSSSSAMNVLVSGVLIICICRWSISRPALHALSGRKHTISESWLPSTVVVIPQTKRTIWQSCLCQDDPRPRWPSEQSPQLREPSGCRTQLGFHHLAWLSTRHKDPYSEPWTAKDGRNFLTSNRTPGGSIRVGGLFIFSQEKWGFYSSGGFIRVGGLFEVVQYYKFNILTQWN